MKNIAVAAFALLTALTAAADAKPRLFVLTDLANEPDDEESLVRLLAYANEFDIEGIAATTSCHLRQNPREDILRHTIAAYGEVWTNLNVHAQGYPTVDRLSAVATSGQPKFGVEGVGEPSPGSRLLAKSIKSGDPRPLWVSIWGGANTLLQALRDCRAEMKDGELPAALAKLRVYSISDQDDAGPAARREFPSVTWIVDPSYPFDYRDYWKSTWNGMAGDVRGEGRKLNLPFVELADNEWLKPHVMDMGPLGKCYPPHIYSMEGDTPSFLGLIANGLGWAESPAYGGWGGRYEWRTPEGESHPIWTSPEVADELKGLRSPGHSVMRWREGYQLDFAGRMKWSVTPKYEDANHNPVAVLNGDRTKGVVRIAAKRGDKVALSAEGSSDPDGDAISFEWSIYREAGTLAGGDIRADGAHAVLDLSAIPEGSSGSLHVILRVRDSGTPTLFAYRRVIVEVDMAPLSYCRVIPRDGAQMIQYKRKTYLSERNVL